MESSDDEVLEAVGFDNGPAPEFGGWYHFVIARHGRSCVSIDSGCTDGRHDPVELIGDSYLRALIGEGIDEMIDGFSLLGVCGSAVDFVEGIDGNEVRALFVIIGCTVTIRALEHDVFLIVGKAGRFERVVLCARAYNNIGLYFGLLFVLGQIEGESVVKSVNTGFEGVSFYRGIGIFLGLQGESTGSGKKGYEKEDFFHIC